MTWPFSVFGCSAMRTCWKPYRGAHTSWRLKFCLPWGMRPNRSFGVQARSNARCSRFHWYQNFMHCINPKGSQQHCIYDAPCKFQVMFHDFSACPHWSSSPFFPSPIQSLFFPNAEVIMSLQVPLFTQNTMAHSRKVGPCKSLCRLVSPVAHPLEVWPNVMKVGFWRQIPATYSVIF